ncbi:TPA: hypothetical protein DCZ39_05950 [Patescibacteria group bacterium]|nr:hypothetical protein [Candidatus Gracilibacteria bacterium]
MYGHVYCTAGALVSVGSASVGELVGINPNKIKNQMTMIAKPEMTNPFLVPHKFLSNHAIFPKISAIETEKYMIAQPIHATNNPMIICFAIVFIEGSK